MGQRTVGIDLAIRGDHVARILDDGQPYGKPIRFRLTSESLGNLIVRLRTGAAPDSAITAVMEPTGMSWFPVALWFKQAGIKVIRVKGQRVRALRRYLSEHTKTDAADAYVLGAIPMFGGIPADPVYVPNAEQHALQRLTRQRERLEDEVTAIKRRLLDLIRWACPAIEAVLPDLRTNLSLAILHDLLTPLSSPRHDARPCSGSLPRMRAAITLIPGHSPRLWWTDSVWPRLKRSACTVTLSTSASCSWRLPSKSIVCSRPSSLASAARSRNCMPSCTRPTRCARSRGSG